MTNEKQERQNKSLLEIVANEIGNSSILIGKAAIAGGVVYNYFHQGNINQLHKGAAWAYAGLTLLTLGYLYKGARRGYSFYKNRRELKGSNQ